MAGQGETISASGTVRALFIFATAPDGMDINPDGSHISECANCGTGWPSGIQTLPPWANTMLEDFGDPGQPAVPQTPGSLSDFFYKMSQGHHRLKGMTLNQVVKSDTSIFAFAQGAGGLWRANRHILEKADALVNFAAFDSGGPAGVPDDVVDYVFIHWQSLSTIHDGQVYRLEEGQYQGAWSEIVATDLVLDGKTIKAQSGAWISALRIEPTPGYPVLVRHRWMLAAVAAHEYGHDLMGVAGLANGGHIATESRYGIMNGSMTPPVMMMSPLERYKLGWIHPQEIAFPTTFPYETTLTLSADYEDGDNCVALVRTNVTQPAPQYFLLEARKPSLTNRPYNAPNPTDSPQCCYRMRDVGEGLLIAHVRENGCGCTGCAFPLAPALFDVEAATGRFNVASAANLLPDPIGGLTRLDADANRQCAQLGYDGPATGRAGDLFRPMSAGAQLFANAFTPFTNPSTNLYDESAGLPFPRTVYSGISIYDIQWVTGQNSMTMKLRIENPSFSAHGCRHPSDEHERRWPSAADRGPRGGAQRHADSQGRVRGGGRPAHRSPQGRP